MSKAAQYLSLFGLGLCCNTALSWIAALTPQAKFFVISCYVFLVIGIVILLLLDDPTIRQLKTNHLSYYLSIACIIVTAILGAILVWLALNQT